MDIYNDTIKNSEINIGLLVEQTKYNDVVIYKELKRRKILCKLLHKQHEVDCNHNKNKHYYCCHKCSSVWAARRKAK